MVWWEILLIVLGGLGVWFFLSFVFYKQFFKRLYDVILSGLAILILSPLYILLILLGAIFLKGNPFFVQPRPGKHEKIFKLIKFRTMSNKKDQSGNLLPDKDRMTKYGSFLRKTSLDELPELFNIFIGEMSIVGPRPLLVKYLPLYSDEQRHRHDVRPGLTGYAQVNGRNSISWKEKFSMDVHYVSSINLFFDFEIIVKTFWKVLKRDGISSQFSPTMEEFKGFN